MNIFLSMYQKYIGYDIKKILLPIEKTGKLDHGYSWLDFFSRNNNNNRNNNTIHLVELTVPFENNIQKAHDRKAQKYRDLVSDILDNGFTCDLTCFEIGSRGLITCTPENIRNIDKIFSFALLNTKPSKSFRKELSKVALLTSYTIWNARQEPAWGSENQPLLSAWFSFHLGVALSFVEFISEFLCLSPAGVVLNVFVCVQPCVEVSPWAHFSSWALCTSFCHAFCSYCMHCLNKGWYNKHILNHWPISSKKRNNSSPGISLPTQTWGILE